MQLNSTRCVALGQVPNVTKPQFLAVRLVTPHVPGKVKYGCCLASGAVVQKTCSRPGGLNQEPALLITNQVSSDKRLNLKEVLFPHLQMEIVIGFIVKIK